MSNQLDYYHILNVPQDASYEDIVAAYERRSSSVESTIEKKLIEDAYDTLSNPDKKAAYDIEILKQVEHGGGSAAPTLVRRSSKSGTPMNNNHQKTSWKDKMFVPMLTIVAFLIFLVIMFINENSTLVNDYNNLADSYGDVETYKQQAAQQQEKIQEVMTQNDNLILQVQELEQSTGTESTELASLKEEYNTLLQQYSELESLNTQLNNENEELLTMNEDLVSELEIAQTTQTTTVVSQNSASPENSGLTFGVGSTKEEVQAIMGTPDSIKVSGSWWDYGNSYITFDFDTELVDGWNNRGELKVK